MRIMQKTRIGECAEISYFFFASRRRHTRLQGDWSSDVCSSDLPAAAKHVVKMQAASWFTAAPTAYTEQVVFSDNKFTSGNGGSWTVTLGPMDAQDRKSTRLNSSHPVISYAVFCLKKKKQYRTIARFCCAEAPLHILCVRGTAGSSHRYRTAIQDAAYAVIASN